MSLLRLFCFLAIIPNLALAQSPAEAAADIVRLATPADRPDRPAALLDGCELTLVFFSEPDSPQAYALRNRLNLRESQIVTSPTGQSFDMMGPNSAGHTYGIIQFALPPGSQSSGHRNIAPTTTSEDIAALPMEDAQEARQTLLSLANPPDEAHMEILSKTILDYQRNFCAAGT